MTIFVVKMLKLTDFCIVIVIVACLPLTHLIPPNTYIIYRQMDIQTDQGRLLEFHMATKNQFALHLRQGHLGYQDISSYLILFCEHKFRSF